MGNIKNTVAAIYSRDREQRADDLPDITIEGAAPMILIDVAIWISRTVI